MLLTIFVKRSILDVWQDFEYASKIGSWDLQETRLPYKTSMMKQKLFTVNHLQSRTKYLEQNGVTQ